MNTQAWVVMLIGLAGIAGQIITAFVVVQVAVRVVETKLGYLEEEINRMRPVVQDHETRLGVLENRVDYFDDPVGH